MAEKKDKIFADGIYFQAPRAGAPEYVKGSISLLVVKAIPFLEAHQNGAGYVNLDVKVSKGGKLYCELNTYVRKSDTLKNEVEENQKGLSEVKTKTDNTIEYPKEDTDPADIPFN